MLSPDTTAARHAGGHPMRVAVICERSGIVRRAMAAAGHDVISCDLEPSDDDSPYHFVGDAFDMLAGCGKFDLLIAHPPCTYLSSSGLHWNNKTPGRPEKTAAALEFVRRLMHADVARICIENPVGRIGTAIAPATQYIHPYQFGDDASKKTGLWLKNLPALTPTARVYGRTVEWPRDSGRFVERWANQTDSGQNVLTPSADRARLRANTYPGIAAAMPHNGVFDYDHKNYIPRQCGRKNPRHV